MIYEGKFEKVVSSTTGQRKDGEGEWKKVQFLVKSNKSTCFIAWTKEAEFVLGLKSGDSITVEFEIESKFILCFLIVSSRHSIHPGNFLQGANLTV